jgi:hypothetical protein
VQETCTDRRALAPRTYLHRARRAARGLRKAGRAMVPTTARGPTIRAWTCSLRRDPSAAARRINATWLNPARVLRASAPRTGLRRARPVCSFGSSTGGACDNNAADHCSGTAATCVDAFRGAETTCRPAANACDVAEACSGTSGACTAPDAFASGATLCGFGASTGGACDNDAADTAAVRQPHALMYSEVPRRRVVRR